MHTMKLPRPCSGLPRYAPSSTPPGPEARAQARALKRRPTGRELFSPNAVNNSSPPPPPASAALCPPHPFPCGSGLVGGGPRPTSRAQRSHRLSETWLCASEEGDGSEIALGRSGVRPPACPPSPPPTLPPLSAPPAVPTPQTTALAGAAAVSPAGPTLTHKEEAKGLNLGKK